MNSYVRQFYVNSKSKIEKDSDLPNFFVYCLTIEMGQDFATVAAVKKCYEECDLHVPSWLASHFSNGLKSKPRRFIKRNGGYRLEEKLREQIAGRLKKSAAENDDATELAGIEYLGIAGGSQDCQEGVEMLLQYGIQIQRARVLTCDNDHCILLADVVGDLIAIKSGFASGYGGEGPHTFSYVLQLLDSHDVEIEEYQVSESTISRLDSSALTLRDLKDLDKTRPVRPVRWRSYVDEQHNEQGRDGTLWRDFPLVIPFAIIDSRLMDLAISFWNDPDDRLLKGYRRLEDLVRKRTGAQEHGSKLFSQVFLGDDSKLTWQNVDEAEKIGRSNLFTAAYMAHRNPRAHKELKSYQDSQLSEFLLLNHLFRLEKEAHESECC